MNRLQALHDLDQSLWLGNISRWDKAAANTGTKDPSASDTLYIEALAAPDTIDTMPEKTLRAFADHGKAGDAMAEDELDDIIAPDLQHDSSTNALIRRHLAQRGAG